MVLLGIHQGKLEIHQGKLSDRDTIIRNQKQIRARTSTLAAGHSDLLDRSAVRLADHPSNRESY